MTREEAIKQLEKNTQYKLNGKDLVALDTAIEALEQTRWIPVSERLPEDNIYVLVTDDAGGLATIGVDAMYTDRRKNHGWYVSQKVTAWMPLPQPYKAESEGKE